MWLTISLGFVMAGTLGNLFDCLGLHGLTDDRGAVICCVRDFIYFRIINWPIFNFADSFLVTGAIMLVLQAFWQENQPRGVVVTVPPADGQIPA
ncbi:MAG: signal peptidase II [Planctomycetales bacterium]